MAGEVTVTLEPFASVTVKRAVKVPALVYTWVGFWVVDAALPSPKSQLKPYGALPPIGVPARLTVSGACPLVGLVPAEALKAGATVIAADAVAIWPAASVTVTWEVNVPALA